MKRALILLAVVGATACKHGITPEKFSLAKFPEGAQVALRVSGERSDRRGELIAVDSVGITIRERRLLALRGPASRRSTSRSSIRTTTFDSAKR